MDAQADLSPHWAHMLEGKFPHIATQDDFRASLFRIREVIEMRTFGFVFSHV